MTNNDTPSKVDRENALENEHGDLDIPFVSADAIILALLEFDSREELLAVFDAAADFETPVRNEKVWMVKRILDECIESSLQIPHIRRGIEIQFELSDLAES